MAVRADQMFKHRTLQDLQQDMRGRQEIGHICKGVDSASETNDPMFPIQLSDLEGFMTDASGRRTHLSRTSNSAQRIVRARIQQVQDDQQTNDPTSDILLPLDMHDQPTDPIDSTANDPKSESTKKKNKKKSSKKKFLK